MGRRARKRSPQPDPAETIAPYALQQEPYEAYRRREAASLDWGSPVPGFGPRDTYPPGPSQPGPYQPDPYPQDPYQQGSYQHGSYEQGPYEQGPYEQGPYQQGPYQQGPYQQGPYQQGPYQQGPYQPGSYQSAAGQYPAGPYQPAAGPDRTPAARPRRRRRVLTVVLVVAALVVGLGGAGGAYLLLHTGGSPQQTAATYLSLWQSGRYQDMSKIILNNPRAGIASAYQQAAKQLGTRRLHLRLGQVSASGGTAVAAFTATDYLASGQVWTYSGRLDLATAHRRWWVRWSPSAIYPALHAGERFALSSTWPARAPILGVGGAVLSSPAVQAQSGSLALLTGYVGPATAKQARMLGAPYKAGDPIGQGGIEQAYQRQLAGRPALTITLAGPGRRIDATVARFKPVPGTPVRTSIDLHYQLAASAAILAATTRKPVDFVAMQASTGQVLAVVERPGGWDRALQGTFPPGSTFKIITASALAERGMTPSSPVQCPSKVTIDGLHIHNANYEQLGATDLLHAFAISCNTTFAMLATQRLDGRALGAMARRYGLNSTPAVGIPAFGGQFTTPQSPVDLAADAFGQGKDLVSPLSQAAVVAAVASGVWRSPELVISPAPRHVAQHPLSPAILNVLRPMMRAVVTIGTAAGVGFGPGVYGKTGTAEYAPTPGAKLQAHSWFIGYRGDLAFAVLVEGGGFGAKAAAPIAKAFLSRVLPGLAIAGGRTRLGRR